MKILIVGLGSMGKRRVRNLQYLKAGELLGFDVRADRREEATARYGIRTCASFDDGLAWNPDALIISTPPDRHIGYAIEAARAGKHFFTELNVVDEGLDELIEELRHRAIVSAPSCTFRHHPSIRTIKKLIDDGVAGNVLYFSYHCGQHLADWHPYEDYRLYYVSQRRTGAGREMVPFELNWLTWLFGPVAGVSCLKAKVSPLEVDIDDLYQCLLMFRGGVRGALIIDVVARPAVRIARFDGEHGAIVWDADARAVRAWSVREGSWREYAEPTPIVEGQYIVAENPYIDEMSDFLAAVRGEKAYGYSFEEDREILRVLAAAEHSSDTGAHVRIDEAATT